MYLYCLFLSVVSAKWLVVKIASKITWTVPIGILNYARQWECFFSVIFARRASRGIFYFGHAESLIPVLAAFGLFRDKEPLREDLFDNRTLADARKFRTSSFMPFSANLAIVLHDCGGNGRSNAVGVGNRFLANVSSADRFYVQLLLNERPVKLPSFRGSSVCSYSELRERYFMYIDRCRFREKCEVSEAKT